MFRRRVDTLDAAVLNPLETWENKFQSFIRNL